MAEQPSITHTPIADVKTSPAQAPEPLRETAREMVNGMTADEAQELENMLAADEAELEGELQGPQKKTGESRTVPEGDDKAPDEDVEPKPESKESDTRPESSGEDDKKDTKDKKESEPSPEQKEPDDGEKEDTQKNGKPLTKEEKELARRDKSWKALNAEKEQIRRDKELLEQEKLLWDQHRKVAEKVEPKFTAQDYRNAAERYDEQGKFDLAELARAEAERLDKQPDQNAAALQAQQAAEFNRRQLAAWSRTKMEFPDATDKESAFHQSLVKFINENKTVLEHPDGPYMAARFVARDLEAGRVPDMAKELETLRAKVKELEESTSLPDGGAPTQLPPPRNFGEMSLEEQERELEREIRLATG